MMKQQKKTKKREKVVENMKKENKNLSMKLISQNKKKNKTKFFNNS